MRILEKFIFTGDEGYLEESKAVDKIKKWLESLKFDTYNKRYVIGVTVDIIDSEKRDSDDE